MQEPAYFMGTEVFPLDPEFAKRERFISLHQLIHWLDKSPYPKGTFPPPAWALLGLAERHIRAGQLKTYGASVRITPKIVSAPGEIIEDGEVHQVEIFDMRADAQEQPKSPLLDIFEFAEWFREIKPDYLELPDNWPAHEVDQVSMSAPQAIPPASIKAADEFWFFAKQRNGYTDLCEDLAHLLYSELGKNATATQAWARLQSRPPHGYEITWGPKDARREMTLQGQKPVTFDKFKRFWNRWVFPTDSTD